MIRALEDGDVDDVIRVWLAATIPGQSFLPESHWRAMEPVIRDELLPVADSWVVEDRGEIVAFVSLLGDVIGGLFTHPDHQGRGHGRALVEHAHQLHDPVFVEVFDANADALRFYRRRGFVDHDWSTDADSGLPLRILRLGGEGARPMPE